MSKPDHLSELKFSSLNLHPTIQQSLNEAGFEYCSPIQAETIPKLIAGKSIAGQAQTGTGKTAAFLLATMHRLLSNPQPTTADGQTNLNPRAFIMAPTRELAIQIHKDAMQLGAQTDLRFALAYGGANYEKQMTQIQQGCDIIIGTPGRLIDYLKKGVYNLKSIEVAVLDEADRMFDLGFIDDVRYIMRRMPPASKRVNLLFSATLSQKVLELAYEHLGDPEHIKIESETVTADRVEQQVYMPANNEKIPLLIGLLRDIKPHRSILFVNTKRDGDKVWGALVANGLEAEVLSGDVAQNKRTRFLKEFSEGKIPILVCTDVAARGLHIPEVSHVFNYDLPNDAEDYVHRIGRTARAGSTGHAISFACETYAIHLPEIEAYIEQKLTIDSYSSELLATDLNPPKRRERSERPRQSNRNQSNRNQSNRNQSNRNQSNRNRSSSSSSQSSSSGRNQSGNNKHGNRNSRGSTNTGSNRHHSNRNRQSDHSDNKTQDQSDNQEQAQTQNSQKNNSDNANRGNNNQNRNRNNSNRNRSRNRNTNQNHQNNHGKQPNSGNAAAHNKVANPNNTQNTTQDNATPANTKASDKNNKPWWKFW